MAEKLKMLMDIFGKVTFGVLIAATVFISVFGGFDAQISVKILWQILAVSAVCSVPILMFGSDASRELTKKECLPDSYYISFCEHCSFRAWKII